MGNYCPWKQSNIDSALISEVGWSDVLADDAVNARTTPDWLFIVGSRKTALNAGAFFHWLITSWKPTRVLGEPDDPSVSTSCPVVGADDNWLISDVICGHLFLILLRRTTVATPELYGISTGYGSKCMTIPGDWSEANKNKQINCLWNKDQISPKFDSTISYNLSPLSLS